MDSFSNKQNKKCLSNSSLIDQQEESQQASIDSKKKWMCQQCTYENWPSAIKCTLCFYSKSSSSNLSLSNSSLNSACSNKNSVNSTKIKKPPNSSSSSNSSQQNANRKLNTQTTNHGTKTKIELIDFTQQQIQPQQHKKYDESENSKWSCSACTYLNWPKSTKCVQCYTVKIQIDSSTSQCLQVDTTTSPKNSPLTRSLCNSPCTVSKSTTQCNENTSLTNNNNNNEQPIEQTVNSDLKKWSCTACTYQNWPKSQRCVMCHVPRNGLQSIQKINAKKNQQQINLKQINYQIQMDRLFLAACQGIVDSDMSHLNRYLNAGGDLTRYLTSEECKFLNRPQVFTVGLTLLHLCYQYKRKELLIKLLNKTANLNNNPPKLKVLNSILKQVNKANKFSPCQSCPSLALNIIDRYFTANLRQRKSAAVNHQHHQSGALGAVSQNYSPTSSLISLNSSLAQTNLNNSPSPSPPPIGATSLSHHNSSQTAICFYVNESHTFTLPNEIEDFSPKIQHILFDELLDRDVQEELEYESRIINWNMDICKRLNSRLYPLWNRHSGDCLLDSVLQACFGVFDTDNILRRVMAESLEQYAACFKPRWKEHEILMAQSLDYKLDDYQLEQDWNNVISLANQPGSSLEQAHIFALCHIFRRPIIVYSVKYVKSFRGENIGFTHFEGVYLPLIWEPSFCFKSPIALGYTRGHFTALVPLDRPEIFIPNSSGQNVSGNSSTIPNLNLNGDNLNVNNPNGSNNSSNSNMLGAVSNLDYNDNNQNQIFYLPLTNSEGKLLPVHFLTSSEAGRERSILRQYLNLDCSMIPGSNFGLMVAQQRVAKRGMLVKQMLDEWLSYYRNMQTKEIGKQIEVIHEKESEDHLIITNNEYENAIQTQGEDEDDEDDEDEDDEDEEEEEEDDEEDEDDDDEDEYENEEYCEEVNVQ